jgi:2EXR family
VQTPLDKFTLFPHLPAELRIKVWKLAIFPRIVMHYSKSSTHVISKPFFAPSYPVLMHTSAQAREVALGSFKVVNAEHLKLVQLRQTLL